MDYRSYQSASSISQFINCPLAYKKKYIDKLPVSPEMTLDAIEHGDFIHKKLEKFGQTKTVPTDAGSKYVEALNKFLAIDDDEIIATEQEYNFTYLGQSFKIIFDAITKKGKALEYKITRSPSWYCNQISYQIRMGALALHVAGIDAQPLYLLFETKREKTSEGAYSYSYVDLHPYHIPVTDLAKEEWGHQLKHWCSVIDYHHKKKQFPPSLNTCGKCFFKGDCDEYSGF